jgi:hypothetical protein
VRQAEHPDEAEADLAKTVELPTLGIASYEAGLVLAKTSGDFTGARVSDTAGDESRSKPPAAETLFRHARLADGDAIELGVKPLRFTTSPVRGSIPSAM